jgi:rRNA-processing protein FCF1
MKAAKFEKYSFNRATVDLPRIEFEEVYSTELQRLEDGRSSRHPIPIIFDTNFLFVTFEFRIDFISQIENIVGSNTQFYIYEGTLSELENIERKGDKNKRFLPLITKMFTTYNFKIIKSKQDYIDDQILENAQKDILIATNDKELRQQLWKLPARVMYMRQKSYLEIK